jgi:hypothetical protein
MGMSYAHLRLCRFRSYSTDSDIKIYSNKLLGEFNIGSCY